MRVSELLSVLQISSQCIDRELRALVVSRLALHTDQVTEGSVFFGLKGSKSHGRAFCDEAFRKGAVLCIVEAGDKLASSPSFSKSSPVLEVHELQKFLPECARLFYGDPSCDLHVVAVTGTSGKTTVTHLLEHIFKSVHEPCGLVGTIENRVGSYRDSSTLTTPDLFSLSEFFSQAIKLGAKHVAMEVSSHALALQRVQGISFEGACFTGLSRDHLDFHGSMENYFEAKALLFEKYLVESRTRGARGAYVIGGADSFSRQLYERLQKKGFGSYGVFAEHLVPTLVGENYRSISFCYEGAQYESPLQGVFNFENVRSSVILAGLLGIPKMKIQSALMTMEVIPGRLEKVEKYGRTVWIDYAHKPDALRKVLSLLRSMHGSARLITLVGCGGDRDKGKRPEMAKIAQELSDHVYFTSDNPRSENPRTILEDMLSGVIDQSNYTTIVDRKAAIHSALKNSEEGDWILIAGKGHEAKPFRDIDVARTTLEEIYGPSARKGVVLE